jgi:hypothetical protein
MYRNEIQYGSTTTDNTTPRPTVRRVRARAAAIALVSLLAAGGAACAAPAEQSGSPGTPAKQSDTKGGTKDDRGGDTAAAGTPAAASGGDSNIVALAGNHGSDTCRQGYVWREAHPTDHVCVDPRMRDQARNDNAQADAHRSPGNGGNGPDACATGYVWREAYPGDLVCVNARVREQARIDNAQADDRRVSTRLWKSRWYPGSQGNGDTGTSRSDQDIPRIQLNGDHYNLGQVRLVIRRNSDNRVLWSGTVNATRHAGFAGGSFGKRTDLTDCSAYGRPVNGHAQAYDVISNRWSARLPVSVGCATL